MIVVCLFGVLSSLNTHKASKTSKLFSKKLLGIQTINRRDLKSTLVCSIFQSMHSRRVYFSIYGVWGIPAHNSAAGLSQLYGGFKRFMI